MRKTDINLYKQDSIPKKVILTFPGITFTNDEVQEELSLSEQVNVGEDFTIGASCAAELNFSLINLNQLIKDTDIAGKEFTYKAGVRTNETSLISIYKAIRPDLMCVNGTTVYASYSRMPYLRMWDITGVPQRLPDPVQPAHPLKSLFIIDGKLYCCHSESPYLTTYSIAGNTPVKLATTALTPFQIDKLQRYNAIGKCFNLQRDISKEYTKKLKDLRADDYIESAFEFIQIGVFKAEKPERKNDNIIKVKAYDRIARFDVIVDDWLGGVTYPTTLGSLLQGLCNSIGIPLATLTFFNSDFIVKKNFRGENVTARQVLQWVAEASASFARMDYLGRLLLSWYADKSYEITSSDYTDIAVSEYTTAKVDKLQIRVTDNDIGVIVGAGTNLYTIENNPLLYAESDTELRPVAEKIFNAIKDFTYVPYTLKCRGNLQVHAGDVVNVTTRKGQSFKAVVMSRNLTGLQALKDVYSASGNQQRAVQSSALNQQITQLRGKTNELTRTVDATISKLYDAKTGDVTILKQTIKGFELAVNNKKLVFDENGLTCFKAGFRINNGEKDTLSLNEDGTINMIGSLTTESGSKKTVIDAGEIKFFNNGKEAGSLYGGYWPDGTQVVLCSGVLSCDTLNTYEVVTRDVVTTNISTGYLNNRGLVASYIAVDGKTYRVWMW